MRKRIISLFLTLVMLLSFMPSLGITAKADGGWKVVNSYAELKTALEGGSANIRLGRTSTQVMNFPVVLPRKGKLTSAMAKSRILRSLNWI